jgi:hypothetical protein
LGVKRAVSTYVWHSSSSATRVSGPKTPIFPLPDGCLICVKKRGLNLPLSPDSRFKVPSNLTVLWDNRYRACHTFAAMCVSTYSDMALWVLVLGLVGASLGELVNRHQPVVSLRFTPFAVLEFLTPSSRVKIQITHNSLTHSGVTPSTGCIIQFLEVQACTPRQPSGIAWAAS